MIAVVDKDLRPLLEELAGFGHENDARETERERRMLNITPETGQLLAILVRVLSARRVLEIGTSNGYSTIWLAWAARSTGGRVTTIERSPAKADLARANLDRAGLSSLVDVREGTALEELTALSGPFDLVFLDADRESYLAYLEPILGLLRDGGLLVTDNVISHAHELTEFLAHLKSDPRMESVTLPVGNGEELTYKRA